MAIEGVQRRFSRFDGGCGFCDLFRAVAACPQLPEMLGFGELGTRLSNLFWARPFREQSELFLTHLQPGR